MPKGTSKLQVIISKRGTECYNIQRVDKPLFQEYNDFILYMPPTTIVPLGSGERLASFDAATERQRAICKCSSNLYANESHSHISLQLPLAYDVV